MEEGSQETRGGREREREQRRHVGEVRRGIKTERQKKIFFPPRGIKLSLSLR